MGEEYGGFGRGGGAGGGYQQPRPTQVGGGSPACAAVEPLLYGFRTRTLDRAQMMFVAQHVATCQHCSALVRQLDAGLQAQQASQGPQRSSASHGPVGRVASWDQTRDADDRNTAVEPPFPASQADSYAPYHSSGRPGFGSAPDVPRWPPMANASGAPGARKPLPEFLRPPLVYFTGGAAVCALLALTFILISLPLLVAPGKNTHRTSGAQTTPTTTAVPLPAFSFPSFSDWRAAYIAADGKVHVVALNGSNNITGPAMSLNVTDTTGGIGSYQGGVGLRQAVAVSPDGHTLAFVHQPPKPHNADVNPPSGPIVLAPLGGGPDRVINVQANDVYWSPDGTQIAFDGQAGGQQGLFVLNVASGQVTGIPQAQQPNPLAAAQILGWVDGSHLALLSPNGGGSPLPTPTAAPTATATASPSPSAVPSPSAAPSTSDTAGQPNVAAVGGLSPLALAPRSSAANVLLVADITTGQAYSLAGLDPGALASISPDGQTVLIAGGWTCIPGPCQGQQQGNAVLVNTATGQMSVLSNSGSVPPLGSFAWSPDSQSVVQTIPSKASQPDNWLVNVVDLEQGAAVTLRTGVFALGWSPDGKTIIVGDASTLDTGTTQAYAVLTASPGTAPVALPGKMTEFLGFVKTA